MTMPEVSVAEAAVLTGLHPQTIREYLRSGRLRSRKVGRIYLIDRRSLRGLIAAKPQPGRPRTAQEPRQRP